MKSLQSGILQPILQMRKLRPYSQCSICGVKDSDYFSFIYLSLQAYIQTNYVSN